MKKLLFLSLILGFTSTIPAFSQEADAILKKVDNNMSSKNRIVESEMVIHGRRNDRTITSKSWSEGDKKSLTEYLAPAREKGTKMLKLDDQLWTFSPSTDRIIQISGHLLRQSVMGSDLSYEDMMEDRKLTEMYNADVVGKENYDGRSCFVLNLTAKVSDVAYPKLKLWIDAERFVPLKEEMYAKSGQLLKKTELKNVVKIGGRWFPKSITYKDMLKDGKGTEYNITDIKFDQNIPDYLFSKAALKK